MLLPLSVRAGVAVTFRVRYFRVRYFRHVHVWCPLLSVSVTFSVRYFSVRALCAVCVRYCRAMSGHPLLSNRYSPFPLLAVRVQYMM